MAGRSVGVGARRKVDLVSSIMLLGKSFYNKEKLNTAAVYGVYVKFASSSFTFVFGPPNITYKGSNKAKRPSVPDCLVSSGRKRFMYLL